MKKILCLAFLLLAITTTSAQTEEELKKEQAVKKDSIAAIQKRIDAIQAKLDTITGWKIGAFGTVGGSLSGFNNWFAQGIPNNSAGNIGITFNGYANLLQKKYFWKNSLTTNFAWVKLDDRDDPTDDDGFREATDVFNFTSLFGYRLTRTLAVSTLTEYRTTILSNFNDPGYLDIGAGITWTPIKNLVIVVHPVNYNFVFSEGDAQYESSLGAKLVADYTRRIGAINFKTNLSAFLSYEDTDYSNWTWTNSFTYTLWKAIGVGFDFGLRSNKQEAYNFALAQVPEIVPTPTLENTDNELQSFWNLGVSYTF
ncbi:DUF3078 domain-containing protein [Aquimarina sp. U1-2]|uniref:DUF3078 domain-containing protein n=1 Tax=Aquimarina sp. U1-2 TaxID=2823141 RepID=UPI001AECE44B|nr:DUF3078 domain-containing protein [Aquimarina sp. U1-2]MBP2831132.1 DUF3078 domain-containing protein [Aquimarina sp. U1-2]